MGNGKMGGPMDAAAGPRRTMRQRLEHEMTEYAVVAL
jgi:hypothetical protein